MHGGDRAQILPEDYGLQDQEGQEVHGFVTDTFGTGLVMSTKHFYQMRTLVAWDSSKINNKRVLGFKRDCFDKFVNLSTINWHKKDIHDLKLGLAINLTFKAKKDCRYLELENRLNNEFLMRINNENFRIAHLNDLINYRFESEKAIYPLYDYLEIYKYCYETISYDEIDVVGMSKPVINIKFHRRPGAVNKIFMKSGEIVGEISLPIQRLAIVEGCTLDFSSSFYEDDTGSTTKSIRFDNHWAGE